MAGYADNRGQNYEIKYLRKVLGKVDERIRVPDNVRGAALRASLDNVYPAVPARPNKKSGATFGLNRFGWQSGLSYAAAFALIVGLFYGLGFNQQPGLQRAVPHGDITLMQPEPDITDPSESVDTPFEPEPAAPFSSGENSDNAHGAASAGESSKPSDPPHSAPQPGGVGGGGKATTLGDQAGFTYAWRANDATDPDKGGFPITVDIVGGDQIAAQINIADMQEILAYYFTDTTISVVGTGERGVVSHCYRITDPKNPSELAALSQPGAYVSSRLFSDTVHVVSYLEDTEDLEIPSEVLPHAVHERACVIGAVDTAEGESSGKAFIGADNDIRLYDLGAYISYMGAPDEGEPREDDYAPHPAESTLHIAQIRLVGTAIELKTVS